MEENGAGAGRAKPVVNTVEIRALLLAHSGECVLNTRRRGGAAGCEVAANALALVERLGTWGRLRIAQKGVSLLPDAPERARQEILAFLRERIAKVLTNTLITRLGDGVAWTSDGRELPCDRPVLAVGISPPDVFRDSRLHTDEAGGLRVDRYLRSGGDGRLFGGGDCLSFLGKTLLRLGVLAVRQGPVIFRNLRASVAGTPLAGYEPKKRYLYVINLGDGTGPAVYGRFSWRGRLSWWLKDRIDERFAREYRS